MAKADLFDLRIFDPIRARSPQQRVMMRGRWASIPIIGGPAGTASSDVRIFPEHTPAVLAELITDRYRGSKHWARRGPRIIEMVDQVRTDHLWQLNLQLILGVRGLLGITTPISISTAPIGQSGAGPASMMGAYNATSYLSDSAWRAYMGDDERYDLQGVSITWSRHRPVSGDSILSVIMDHDDPLEVVLAEQPVPQRQRRLTPYDQDLSA
jgi:hypothetical protein